MSDVDVIRRVPLEILNKGRTELIDETFTPDFVEHLELPGFPPGRDGFRLFTTAVRAAFPDLKYAIVNEVHEGDKHLIQVQVSGTMKGDFMGMPATDKSATWNEMHLTTIRNGKITEHWGVVDQLSMLQQLGVIPAQPGS